MLLGDAAFFLTMISEGPLKCGTVYGSRWARTTLVLQARGKIRWRSSFGLALAMTPTPLLPADVPGLRDGAHT